MKYIDAEKLIAEIERRRLSNRYIDTEGYENELLEIINSLQQEQPEVDLAEEIDTYIRELPGVHSFDNGMMWWKGTYKSIKLLASHFYELGLNAGKEE